MALDSVIFDNTVFNYFLRLKTVNLELICRSLIKEKVLIPSQIVVEMERLAQIEPQFLPKINKWIELSYRKSFYQFCDTFDSIIFETVSKKLDIGEAGAIAQAEKTRVRWFISDDIKNLPFITQNYNNIRVYSIYFLICLADISGLLADYNVVIKEFLAIRKYSYFNSKTRKQFKASLRYEYTEALKLYGISYNKKLISRKTSIDTILKN
ncbi:MAG: hypothetical protein A2046_05265 [Bacteroidetes bacterium GWA2_30_7]|nr:MAG: hypothetical protein A2046_05265 [Bacteroidetes bacterium GWA2_30_7]